MPHNFGVLTALHGGSSDPSLPPHPDALYIRTALVCAAMRPTLHLVFSSIHIYSFGTIVTGGGVASLHCSWSLPSFPRSSLR